MTLLEKAKSQPVERNQRSPREQVPEEIELAVAYVRGEVRRIQCARALGVSPTNFEKWLAPRLVHAIRSGAVDNLA